MKKGHNKACAGGTLFVVLMGITVLMLMESVSFLNLKDFTYYTTHSNLYWGIGLIAFLIILITVIKVNFFNPFDDE